MGGAEESAFALGLGAAATDYASVWGDMVNLLTGNAALMIFLFGGLVAMAWKHFKRAKKAVRG